MGVKIPWPGYLDPHPFDNFEIRNVVTCQRTQMILGDIYSSIVFSITTLFYQSHSNILHSMSGK